MGRPIGKRHQEDVRKYYVYWFRLGDKPVYVGKGCGDRFEVQRRRFEGYKGEIFACMFSEKHAFDLEAELIKQYAPDFNIKLNDGKAEPWKYRLVPEKHQDFYLWCNAIGSRQVAARILIAKGEEQLKQFGIEIKTLLSRLDPWCEVLNARR